MSLRPLAVRRLLPEEREAISGVVSEGDLDRMRLVFTIAPGLWGASGTTLGRWVLVDPAAPRRPGWLRLLAHEAVHVEQYGDRGLLGFGIWYLAEYVRARLSGQGHWDAYEGLGSEIEARERAAARIPES